MQINSNFVKLPANYLFKEISYRMSAYKESHPHAKLLRMGVGDVTRPLPQAVIRAMHDAVEDLGHEATFRGYGPEEGYDWLRQRIIENDYVPRGISLDISEVFIGEGAGSDLGNLSELFDTNNSVAILDPTYPAYVDANVMAGRSGDMENGKWSYITYLPCHAENGFIPDLPPHAVDIIYLCFPNNPTGSVLTRAELKKWVDFALLHNSIIIYDSAYEAYITDPDIPHSIYEIDGAKHVAIEVRSYSKSAGFTAVRCGYTVVPQETGLREMWLRRQCTKYNGTSYVAQRAAEATYTPEGKAGVQANLAYYSQTAMLVHDGLKNAGFEVFGAVNSPYIWCRTPYGMDSWSFFQLLLDRCQIICTPGGGFGQSGEGYVRFSAFSARNDCEEAIGRICSLL